MGFSGRQSKFLLRTPLNSTIYKKDTYGEVSMKLFTKLIKWIEHFILETVFAASLLCILVFTYAYYCGGKNFVLLFLLAVVGMIVLFYHTKFYKNKYFEVYMVVNEDANIFISSAVSVLSVAVSVLLTVCVINWWQL